MSFQWAEALSARHLWGVAWSVCGTGCCANTGYCFYKNRHLSPCTVWSLYAASTPSVSLPSSKCIWSPGICLTGKEKKKQNKVNWLRRWRKITNRTSVWYWRGKQATSSAGRAGLPNVTVAPYLALGGCHWKKNKKTHLLHPIVLPSQGSHHRRFVWLPNVR